MAENRFTGLQSSCGSAAARETIAIDADRILDCCRDRDCFEDAPVFLTSFGRELIEHTTSVRVKSASVIWSKMDMDPIQFNCGFYAIRIRFFVKLLFEANVGACRPQEFEGVTVLEKKVILYGGESNVSVFRSGSDFPSASESTAPTAVVEVVTPVTLAARAQDPPVTPCCCCAACDIPENVVSQLNGPLSDGVEGRTLLVSLGIFSVVRIVRRGQYLIQATEYSVPDKECISGQPENPCHLFRSMAFPTSEFNPASQVPPPAPPATDGRTGNCGCGGNTGCNTGCGNNRGSCSCNS